MRTKLFEDLREKLREIAQDNDLLSENVTITCKGLTVEEAIGNPKRQDFPLVKGKEKLLQATFRGAHGQAFTDQPGIFNGNLADIIDGPLDSNFDLALFTATLNAVLRYLGLIEKTVHCKDEEPEKCSDELVVFLKEKYNNPKVTLIGYQPSIFEKLSKNFDLRVLDLDDERIGTEHFGIIVENGETARDDALEWADVVLVTGSTLANGTIGPFLTLDKPVIFYGTTIAGAAYLLGLERFCECGK